VAGQKSRLRHGVSLLASRAAVVDWDCRRGKFKRRASNSTHRGRV